MNLNDFRCPLPTQLLPCLAVPFVELFPDLCLGWWFPPSMSIYQYKKMWYLRAPLQFIAFFPLFEMIHTICTEGSTYALLVLGFIVSIALRNILMSKEVDRVTSIPLWSTNLPWDKRKALLVVITSVRPTNINNFDEMVVRYVPFATKIGAAVMLGIVNLVRQHLDEADNLKLMGGSVAVIVGGVGIGGFRYGSVVGDCICRCLFGAGFITVLYYTAQVAEIVQTKAV